MLSIDVRTRFLRRSLWSESALAALALSLAFFTYSAQVPAQDWVFEGTFEGDPSAPSQALLPRSFEYVTPHRSHPKEQFARPHGYRMDKGPIGSRRPR